MPTDQGERELMLDRQSAFIYLGQADEGAGTSPIAASDPGGRGTVFFRRSSRKVETVILPLLPPV